MTVLATILLPCVWSIGPSIKRLLRAGRPTTVARLVVAVVVREAVNRMLGGWARAHVVKERSKVLPGRTHGYAPATIIIEADIFRIATTLVHAAPSAIFRKLRPSNCRSMARVSSIGSCCHNLLSGSLFLDASAATGVPVPQTRTLRDGLSSAIATGVPPSSSAGRIRGARHNRQSSKPVTAQIGYCHVPILH